MSSFALGVYRLATAVLAPLAGRRLAGAAARDGADLARQAERHGKVAEASGEIWVHAASVGELNAAEPLIRALLAARPDDRFVVSTLTTTGAAECARRFDDEDRVRHLFAPLDSRARVKRWLDATQPKRLLLVETELWPELLQQCHARSIPVALVNARLSDRAFPRYRRLRGLISPVLAGIDPVLCQSGRDAERYLALGASAESVFVCGNMKLDLGALPPPSGRVRGWLESDQSRPVWIAGSTHAVEEEMLARAHARLIERIPHALLVLAPRHPERAAAALGALSAAGLAADRIDQLRQQPDLAAVVVDRMGVLAELYQLSDACFVGGTLVEGIGGHNLFEPALAGRPVLSGPYLENQREIAAGLRGCDGLIVVDEAVELATTLESLLNDEEFRKKTGSAARGWAEAQRGAVSRTIAALVPAPTSGPDAETDQPRSGPTRS